MTEIDETDMERMLEFILYYLYWKKKTAAPASKKKEAPHSAYADEIQW